MNEEEKVQKERHIAQQSDKPRSKRKRFAHVNDDDDEIAENN